MKDKYLIIEQHKFSTFNDIWTIKYHNQTYDQAFEKYVCLVKLNEDKNIVYYLCPCNHLWTKPIDDKKDNEKIKPDQETSQEEMPF